MHYVTEIYRKLQLQSKSIEHRLIDAVDTNQPTLVKEIKKEVIVLFKSDVISEAEKEWLLNIEKYLD